MTVLHTDQTGPSISPTPAAPDVADSPHPHAPMGSGIVADGEG